MNQYGSSQVVLGPPISNYKFNPIALVIVGLLGILFLLILGSLDEGVDSKTTQIILGVIVAALALAFVWILSVRLSVHEEGISYRSLFGSKEMRWDEIDRLYYRATKQSVNFIPVGTYYWFKLVDKRGKSLSFGNRFERQEDIGNKLIELTYRPLLARAADQFDNNVELDFGDIRVSRQHGLKVKKWSGWKTIPWDQVADYSIDEGTFYIWPVGKKYTGGPGLAQVPNAFVLVGLLDAILKRQSS